MECESENRCWLTQHPGDSDSRPMFTNPVLYFIGQSHAEICAISRHEERQKQGRDKKQYIVYLPTLENLDFWSDCNDWETSPVAKEDFLIYVMIFHSAYTNALLKKTP